MATARSAKSRVIISFSVMSRRASISPRTKASCASRRQTRRRPYTRAVVSPSRARAIQRIAVDIPTPNRVAARRADDPSAEAFKTRSRRSSLSARAIAHLLNDHVESGSQSHVTSQSIQPRPELL